MTPRIEPANELGRTYWAPDSSPMHRESDAWLMNSGPLSISKCVCIRSGLGSSLNALIQSLSVLADTNALAIAVELVNPIEENRFVFVA
jgi:hypothetical protein